MITAHTFLKATECRLIRGIRYLPYQRRNKRSEEQFGREAKALLNNPVFTARSTLKHPHDQISPTMARMIVEDAYEAIGDLPSAKQPEWVQSLSLRFRQSLRVDFTKRNDDDLRMLVQALPGHPFGYIVTDDQFLRETADALHIGRLNGIRQLSYLIDPAIELGSRGDHTCTLNFSHTRHHHSWDVTALLILLMENIPEFREFWRELISAGLGHDSMTPAGGDAIKAIDPKSFCEERRFLYRLENPRWIRHASRYGINTRLVNSIVCGEGVLGQALDICDKAGYMGRDSSMLQLNCANDDWSGIRDGDGFKEIYTLLENHRNICALWQYARVVNDTLIIEDPEALERFLRLRVLLFRYLYYNPLARGLQHGACQIIVRYMYETRMFAGDDLFEWTDEMLHRAMRSATGFHNPLLSLSDATIRSFRTEEAAERFIAQYDNDTSVLAYVYTFRPVSHDGTTKFYVSQRGKVMTYASAYPAKAKAIASIMHPKDEVRAFVIPMDTLGIRKSLKLRRKLKKYRHVT